MVISTCQHPAVTKNGTHKSGKIRYRCKLCGKSWTEFTRAFDGMRIGMDLAVRIVTLLCEGMSVSATARVTGTKKQTVIDLCNLVGRRCEAYMAQNIKGVQAGEVQLDELWQYIYCKRATASREKYVGGCGDSWCFTAIERHTKLLLSWHFGRRSEGDTFEFCRKLSEATTGKFHISTDGFTPYPWAILRNFQNRVSHGIVMKQFGEAPKEDRRKYSPARIVGIVKYAVRGIPRREQVCTSHCERMNGSIRTFCKRMARLTYCFSKRWGNHHAALGLLFAHYNYCRKHRTLKGQTPAMAHGLENHVWSVRELLERVTFSA